MGIVINLDEKRKKKRDNPVVDTIRDSLDNDAVKRRYGIKPKEELRFEEKADKIKQSIARINGLMAELQQVNKKEDKR